MRLLIFILGLQYRLRILMLGADLACPCVHAKWLVKIKNNNEKDFRKFVELIGLNI